MVTLLVITMLFMILKVFNLDMMKDHLNQKLVLSVMMIFIWGITFYITHFNKKRCLYLEHPASAFYITFISSYSSVILYCHAS